MSKGAHNYLVIELIVVLGVLSEGNAWASLNSSAISWWGMAMAVCGGLALFLLGMEHLTDALKGAAGTQLQLILTRLTGNRFMGAIVGAVATGVIQSSSITTVLVVGFVSAQVMTLSQAIGVIMGANIGSTVTAQIIAFKVTHLALAFVALGYLLAQLCRRDEVKHLGGALLGLGMIFLGMNVMSEAMAPLRAFQPFVELMANAQSPLWGLMVGAVLTALIQSSAATTGIVIMLASQGVMPLITGVTIALGANIGTCVTALLATIGRPRVALRAAAVHVVFNLVGVAIWILFIDHLAALAVMVSPVYPELSGVAKLAATAPRQIANANTLFNIINTVLLIGFTPYFERLVLWLVPPSLRARPLAGRPQYLEQRLLDTPSAALEMVRLETGRLGDQILLVMLKVKPLLETPSLQKFNSLKQDDDAIDALHTAIMQYLNAIGKRELSDSEIAAYYKLLQAVELLEGIGDIFEGEIAKLGIRMAERKLLPSAAMRELLEILYGRVYTAVKVAVRATVDNDPEAARQVLAMRAQIEDAANKAFEHQASSLANSPAERLAILQIEFELADQLKRIFSVCKRIARLFGDIDKADNRMPVFNSPIGR